MIRIILDIQPAGEATDPAQLFERIEKILEPAGISIYGGQSFRIDDPPPPPAEIGRGLTCDVADYQQGGRFTR